MESMVKWLSIGDRYTKMYLDKQLAGIGLNSSQYMYIIEICQNPGITQDQFISLFYLNPSNITRVLIRLEQEGFIEKRSNPMDKRTCRLYPTERAQKANVKILEIIHEWHTRIREIFTPQEEQLFLKLLERVGNQAILIMTKEENENGENTKKTAHGGEKSSGI